MTFLYSVSLLTTFMLSQQSRESRPTRNLKSCKMQAVRLLLLCENKYINSNCSKIYKKKLNS